MDFDRIYRAYFREIYFYIRGLCGNESAAEEIAQEVFVKALNAADRFNGEGGVRAWLYAIARNTYFTWHKRRKIYAAHEPDEGFDDGISVLERLGDEENAFRIHEFLHGMKEPYKEVFSLRVFGELGFEKIGRLFGRSANWARVTFYRAKLQIMDHMEAINNEQDQL